MVGSEPDAVRVAVRPGDEVLFTLMDAADSVRLGTRRLSLGSHGYADFARELREAITRELAGEGAGDVQAH